MYPVPALIKSALLLFSAASLLVWLPTSYLRAHDGNGLLTIYHNDTASPIEALPSDPFLVDTARNQHAYVFYATEPAYACAALINIDRLRNTFNSTYRIIVIAKPSLHSVYLKKFISYNVDVLPYQPPPIPAEYPYYADVLLKLVSFRLHQYIPMLERILVLDADQLIYKSLDHLFSLPSVDLAAPRVYWGDDPAQVTSALMLIELSDRIWDKIDAAMTTVDNYKFDMDIVNDVFRNYTMILPGDYCTLNSHLEDSRLPSWYQGNGWAISNRKKDSTQDSGPHPQKHGLTNETSGEFVEKRADALEKRQTSPSDVMHEENIELPDLAEIEKQEQLIQKFGKEAKEQNAKLPKSGDESNEDPQEISISAPIQVDVLPSTPASPAEMSDDERKEKELSELRWRKHDLMETLQTVYEDKVKVLHFSAVKKPWQITEAGVRRERPDAHPLLAEQFRIWRVKAKEICPGHEDLNV